MYVVEITRPMGGGVLRLSLCDASRMRASDIAIPSRVVFRAETAEIALTEALRFVDRHGLADEAGLEVVYGEGIDPGPSVRDLIAAADELARIAA